MRNYLFRIIKNPKAIYLLVGLFLSPFAIGFAKDTYQAIALNNADKAIQRESNKLATAVNDLSAALCDSVELKLSLERSPSIKELIVACDAKTKAQPFEIVNIFFKATQTEPEVLEAADFPKVQ